MLTPLQANADRIVHVILAIVYFLEAIFFINAVIRSTELAQAIEIFIIVMGLVPSGLFLSTVVAYSLAAVKVGNVGTLVQQANAVESLAYVNVLCTDKTGTLTTNRLKLQDVFPIGISPEDFERAMIAMTHSTASPNKTSQAISEALPGEPVTLVAEVPFSSARKWSATAFDTQNLRGIYALGAPEFVKPYLKDDPALQQQITEQSAAWAQQGLACSHGRVFPRTAATL